MTEQRFKVGDRVVRTGPTWNGAFNGQTYTVSRVDSRGEMMDLIGVDGGCMFAFEACNFHPADKQRGVAAVCAQYGDRVLSSGVAAHPWASELRKFALVETQNVTDGAAHQVHPFCNTGKPRGKDVVLSAHVREQIGGWCVLEQRSPIRSSSPFRFSLYEAKP